MDQSTLVAEQLDAGAEFVERMGKYVPLSAAFWGKRPDDEPMLYIASEKITDQNFDVAYGEVLRIAAEMQNPNFDPFQVKIIWMNDPMTQDAISICHKFPLKLPTRIARKVFGGRSMDEVYIYPVEVPVTAK